MISGVGVNCQLVRFGLVTAQADLLTQFYVEAFGAHRLRPFELEAQQTQELLGVNDNMCCETTRLGNELIDFFQFGNPGQPYATPSSATDLCFQHFAIVVSDMRTAFERLQKISGWTAITRNGPQRLPQSSGGVTAFKFRDPEGHPLELLEFPSGNIPSKWRQRPGTNIFLGIDHSAIGIRDTAISQPFYERLGFVVSGRSLNRGPEQEELDNVPGAVVQVTALSNGGGPHIELLCYSNERSSETAAGGSTDVAATRLFFGTAGARPLLQSNECFLDPDRHHLVIIDCPNSERFP